MSEQDGLGWQIGVWNTLSETYVREIDPRFATIVASVVERAALRPGETVLDLGTGTGAVAGEAARLVGASGKVLAVDVSPEMLALARKRVAEAGLSNVDVVEGRGEAIPAPDGSVDVVTACLSLMYAIDRQAAAREVARVLKPGGRFVATVWAGPEVCDIVRFQSIAGSFAGPPPVPGVGPGALADPTPFLEQLTAAGLDVRVEDEVHRFTFPDFGLAWQALAVVTTAHLPPESRKDAEEAVLAAMYPDGPGPRDFTNTTHFIVGSKRS